MEEVYFEWNNKLKVMIYGVNDYSMHLVDLLKRAGFEVIAFIDRRAKELGSVLGVMVYELDDSFIEIEDPDRCAIIMLQNAMQHDGIAADLHGKGIEKIVYVPMHPKANSEYICEMTRIYNAFLIGDFGWVRRVPCYQPECPIAAERLDTEDGLYCTIEVGADLVYTRMNEHAPYADVPLMSFAPFRMLFEYMAAECHVDFPKEYLAQWGVNSCNYANPYTDDGIVRQRGELYELWCEHFNEGMEFFRASAPLAEWNAKGYFNLCEGQHRTMFLIVKGVRHVPLRVSKSDYGRWKAGCQGMNYEKISLIDSMLWIHKNLPKDAYFGKKVLCLDDMGGYYAKRISLMGGNVRTIIGSELVEDFDLAVLVGLGEQISDVKRNALSRITSGHPLMVLACLTREERMALEKEGVVEANWISKVFWETGMLNLYLCQSRLAYNGK